MDFSAMNFLRLYIALAVASGTAAQNASAQTAPIISDEEFERALSEVDDIASEQAAPSDPGTPGDEAAPIGDFSQIDPLVEDPLPPLESFDAEPYAEDLATAADDDDEAVRYVTRIEGLATKDDNLAVLDNIHRRFRELSTLGTNENAAESRAAISARARSDRQLLVDLLSSEGFYDARVELSSTSPKAKGEPVRITLLVRPNQRYRLGTVDFDAPPEVAAQLIRPNFVPKSGDPIVADAIVAAEAQVSLALPQNGYPFAQLGQRDILLDEAAYTGDYRLPVAAGPKSYFGKVRTEGKQAFDADHIALLRRFKTGELYDSRKVDDLREALIATGLLSMVSVEPVAAAETASDGMAVADLLVKQEAGPARTIAATAGYETGRGFRAEGSWTHRNILPPEGALAATAILGTQEQALGLIFNRSNAGKRDRTVELSLSAQHKDYEAFDAYTGRLAGTLSYQSTPIWQKTLTYALGFELLASYESLFDFSRLARDRQLFYVAALPTNIGFDRSDDLLNPSRGYRINLRLSPEASLNGSTRFYLRGLLEGSIYHPFGDALVLAARARLGSIIGTSRNSLAPSRRYYGGGGGSVRGFGFQKLGPIDIEDNPVGGKSLNEVALEARYRFGNFGAVAFVDAGQVYAQSTPQFNNWRTGVGLGGRYYTNFGPVRIDVATPLGRRSGDSLFTVYVSLGQAF